MNQYPSSPVKPFSNKDIAGREMLDYVLVIHVIDIDNEMLEVGKELFLIERESQHGYYMGDIGLAEGVFAPQGE